MWHLYLGVTNNFLIGLNSYLIGRNPCLVLQTEPMAGVVMDPRWEFPISATFLNMWFLTIFRITFCKNTVQQINERRRKPAALHRITRQRKHSAVEIQSIHLGRIMLIKSPCYRLEFLCEVIEGKVYTDMCNVQKDSFHQYKRKACEVWMAVIVLQTAPTALLPSELLMSS